MNNEQSIKKIVITDDPKLAELADILGDIAFLSGTKISKENTITIENQKIDHEEMEMLIKNFDFITLRKCKVRVKSTPGLVLNSQKLKLNECEIFIDRDPNGPQSVYYYNNGKLI